MRPLRHAAGRPRRNQPCTTMSPISKRPFSGSAGEAGRHRPFRWAGSSLSCSAPGPRPGGRAAHAGPAVERDRAPAVQPDGLRPHPGALGLVAQAASRDARRGAGLHIQHNRSCHWERQSHAGFVHESGRALFEIGLPWLDSSKAATVDPRRVTVPLLFVGAEKDKLVPPGVVRRTARSIRPRLRLCRV